MKTEKHDRRSERTRRLLGDALNALMLERRYDDLTVQDILDRANVGRSTFYAHFWDKEDLLTSQIEEMLEGLMRQMQAAPVSRDALFPSLALLYHIRDFYPLYLAQAHGAGFNPMIRTFHLRLCEYAEQRLRAWGSLPDTVVTMTGQAVVGAFLSLVEWWLENKMPLSPEALNDHFHRLVMPGVRAVTGQ